MIKEPHHRSSSQKPLTSLLQQTIQIDLGLVELGDPDHRIHILRAKQKGVVKLTSRYRAPELLIGDSRWTFANDAWLLGCLGVELVQRSPIFPATDQVDLLCRITTTFGKPMAGGGLS